MDRRASTRFAVIAILALLSHRGDSIAIDRGHGLGSASPQYTNVHHRHLHVHAHPGHAFIQSENITEELECSAELCRGRGFCSNPEDRKHSRCICKAEYSGEACEKWIGCHEFSFCHGHGHCALGLAGFNTSGICLCYPGFEGEDCSQTTQQECPLLCSGRGVCEYNERKGSFGCRCDAGYSGEGCETLGRSACPSECSGNGRCFHERNTTSGASIPKCICASGTSGEDCGELEITCGAGNALRGCAHGTCGERGSCECKAGFEGEVCNVYVGRGVEANSLNATDGQGDCEALNYCSGLGVCTVEEGVASCTCFEGFGGPTCAQVDVEDLCPSFCNGHGKCVLKPEPHCSCSVGWSGADCSVPLCPYNASRGGLCSGRGVCERSLFSADHVCTCDSSYLLGPKKDCSTSVCPRNCRGRGVCVRGECRCSAGFWGDDCGNQVGKTTIAIVNSSIAIVNSSSSSAASNPPRAGTSPANQTQLDSGVKATNGTMENGNDDSEARPTVSSNATDSHEDSSGKATLSQVPVGGEREDVSDRVAVRGRVTATGCLHGKPVDGNAVGCVCEDGWEGDECNVPMLADDNEAFEDFENVDDAMLD